MTLLKRLKNLWALSEWDLRQGDTFRIQKLSKNEKSQQSQFLEPVPFKDRFNYANSIDDLLENE